MSRFLLKDSVKKIVILFSCFMLPAINAMSLGKRIRSVSMDDGTSLYEPIIKEMCLEYTLNADLAFILAHLENHKNVQEVRELFDAAQRITVSSKLYAFSQLNDNDEMQTDSLHDGVNTCENYKKKLEHFTATYNALALKIFHGFIDYRSIIELQKILPLMSSRKPLIIKLLEAGLII